MGRTHPSEKAIPALSKLVLERVRVFPARQEIELGSLTLLAGANSSGKSTAMLGALLLKQTLDAPLDPGALRLSAGPGSHVELTHFDQLRSTGTAGPVVLGIQTTLGYAFESSFERGTDGEIVVAEMTAHGPVGRGASLRAGGTWRGKPVRRARFFLGREISRGAGVTVPPSAGDAGEALEHIIHVPGLRTPPQRDYALTATGDTFAGRFDAYFASVLLDWQRKGDLRLHRTADALRSLGMTWKVRAERRGDTQVSILVGRLPAAARGGAHDLVDVADVGVGVSQALPVIVALLRAQPGQVVYLEQPELHLHPRAQNTMAALLVDAAIRGVRVVAETHSTMLLLGIRAQVVARSDAPDDVFLHWFTRQPDGSSRVDSARLDRSGTLGNVPADFDDVELEAHRRYLDAVEQLSA